MILLLASHDIRALFTKAWNLTKYSNTNSTPMKWKYHIWNQITMVSLRISHYHCAWKANIQNIFPEKTNKYRKRKKDTERAVLKRKFGCLLAFPNQITHGPWQKSQKTAEKGRKKTTTWTCKKKNKRPTNKQWKNQPTTKNEDWGRNECMGRTTVKIME